MNKSIKVAVASRSFSKNPVLRKELESAYSQVTYNEAGKVLNGTELIEFLKGHEKAITGLETINESILIQLPELKVIGKYGVGLDMLDLSALQNHGVKLGWTAGVNKRSVSELAICFMTALLRHVQTSHSAVIQGHWQPLVGGLLTGRTVGIMGCGNIGKDLTLLLKPYDCRILAYDIVDYKEFYKTHGIKHVTLDELLSESDVVTLHVPLDQTTKKIINATRLGQMKKSAILLNCARGGLVDENALIESLIHKKIAGAAFDVFETEPPGLSPLFQLPNFLCTAHIGGHAEEAMLAMGRAAIAGLDHARNALDYVAPKSTAGSES